MEIFDLALSMELDLEKFYRGQAELNDENSLKVVFTLLANEEKNHAKLLGDNANKLSLSLEDSHILSEVQPIFKNIANFTSNIKDLPDQLDIYRMALEKEQQSLKFYKELHVDATEEKTKTVFEYLAKQEEKHCVILEELIKLLTRPEEWVESAEFSVREEY